MRPGGIAAAVLVALALGACAKKPPQRTGGTPINENPYASTYVRYPGVPTVIRNATIFDGIGGQINGGTVIIADGVVKAVGTAALRAPAGAVELDGTGKFVTPGIIDVHSHLGNYPSPGVESHSDGNEATSPSRPEVWAEHSVWPQDPGFSRALANGGVTTLQVLPGSANLFGGRSVTLKNVYARTVQGMKFPGAPYGLKMACGENPKRSYGSKGSMPQTRMGNIAYTRATWIEAQAYKRKWDAYERNGGVMPSRDLVAFDGVVEGADFVAHLPCHIEHDGHFVGAVAVVVDDDLAREHAHQRLAGNVARWHLAAVLLIGVPLALIFLGLEPGLADVGNVAHPRLGHVALAAVDPLGILAARHLEAVRRAGEFHPLHGARGDVLERHRSPAE